MRGRRHGLAIATSRHVSSLFYLTKCTAASCGVAQEDANGTCPAPTALHLVPSSMPTKTPAAPCGGRHRTRP